MPVLLFGIDLTDMMKAFQSSSEEFFRTKDATAIKATHEDSIKRGLKAAALIGVRPRARRATRAPGARRRDGLLGLAAIA
jgi:hypothetical protein